MKVKLAHRTAKHQMQVLLRTASLPTAEIKTNKPLFDSMCRSGCRNFNNKYCCPPYAPEFSSFSRDYPQAFAILHTIELATFPKAYNSIRMVNSVTKAMQRRQVNALRKTLKEKGLRHRFLANGACRLCRSCSAKTGEPCTHPDKMSFSMEATGIDVNHLVQHVFSVPLQWYSRDNYPEYQGVVGLLLLQQPRQAIIAKKELEILLKNNYAINA